MGTRKKRGPSEWNLFVKKIFHEGRKNNANYKFKNALEDASKRKSEMSSNSSVSASASSNASIMSVKRPKHTRRRHSRSRPKHTRHRRHYRR